MYSYGFALILLLCIIVSVKELKMSNQFSEYAKHVSIFSLLINSIWNHFIFLIQFFVVMRSAKLRFILSIPTILLFLYTNVFLAQSFIYSWKSRNIEFIVNNINSQEIRASLFKFNCKIYLAILTGLIFLFNVIVIPSVLLPFLCILWIPQIFENIINSSSKAPSIPYLLCVSIEHLYIPVLLSITLGIPLPHRRQFLGA